mgnify:CR=1 FL=1
MVKNYLFISFAIPDNEMMAAFAKDKTPQIQTHKFIWNMISGVTNSDEVEFTHVVTRPVSDYPYYKDAIIKKQEWRVDVLSKKISMLEIPFINTSILKIITRFFSALFYSFSQFHKKRSKSGVVVYSVHVPFMAVGFIVSRVYKIDLIGIWTDPPSVITVRESYFKRSLRRIEFSLSKWLMTRFSKVIVLTKHLAEDFAPGKPYLVVEGMIDEKNAFLIDDVLGKCKKIEDSTVVVYTGSLKSQYGIKNIIDAVLLTKEKKLVLEIYGAGDMEHEILEISKANDNIRFFGWVPNPVAMKAQREADFLINARAPGDEYTKYSFPSKILEYMLSGTPIITTILPGMPDEYSDYVLKIEGNDPESICDALKIALSMSLEKRCQLGLKALDFAKEKGYRQQGAKILSNIF